MRITLIVIGRMKSGPETELFDRYFGRSKKSGKSIGFDFSKIIEFPESKQATVDARRKEEAEKITSSLSSNSQMICLDEKGENLTSQLFSRKISDLRDDGYPEITFVIGGPDGLEEGLRNKCQHLIAFGKMTFPHMMMRILLMEQLYRAITIDSGHPYHRE